MFSLLAPVFLSCSCLNWTLEGSPVKAQSHLLFATTTFRRMSCVLNVVLRCPFASSVDQVWWVPSSLPWLSSEDLWWWGRPGTQQELWEVCPLWPCVLQVRSSSAWAGRWLLASEWSSPPLLVSIMHLHLHEPVSGAPQAVWMQVNCSCGLNSSNPEFWTQ